MFDRLSDGFSSAFKKLSGKGKISEANVREAMDEVRDALLDADVNYEIVNDFCDSVVDRAVGTEVTKSLSPQQEMVGIVHKALVDLMSAPTEPGVPRVSPGPTVVMMCGLQGSGKTTTCGKLAAYLKKRGRSVMLAAADLQRPAAVDQLRTVAQQVETEMPGGAQVHFYAEPDKVAEYGKAVGAAITVCQNAYKAAKAKGVDTLILDTAGRLHVNDDLMGELRAVNRALQPHHILLVVDAMTGQDAVNSAKAFHEQLEIDGVILTKFDSDTRGGAALSVKKVTGAPIRFIGVGEKLDAIEEFHAERVAGRILGMGDVVSLVERAQQEVSEEEAERMAEKMAKGQFTMEDFLDQMRTLRKMGPMKQLLGMLPGVGQALKDVQVDEKQLDRIEGIVNSMTPTERKDVNKINPSRRKRIARGSGVKPEEVSQLVKQFGVVSKLSQQFSGMGIKGKMKAMKDLQAAGGAAGALGGMGMPALPGMGRKGSTHTASPKTRFKKRRK
ncbi:MAG: signal recognition particle protein [Phycisphaeraceae bacterium]|nr:signal recognition particle protein [Phycisphaerales bacterium]MCB9843308.1 signal recognition particle protein [Phycisphaeraceae bacterium]